uniref:Putative ovule protein n=1 Tax=Solanum chacoense TaxID=4108 RepID=A0A0V0GYI9_SOLCH
MLESNRTIDAIAEPTAVPFTSASPSLGCNSKNPSLTPAMWKASSALSFSPLGPTALELGLPVSKPAMSDKGTRSPEAVTVPRRGKHGVMLVLINLVIASKISNLMPE